MGSSVGGSLNSRAQDGPLPASCKVRVTVTVGREEEANPAASAFGARLLELLHRHLSGSPSLSGDRSADYFSKALRGEPGKVLTLTRDIAQLATRPEKEARAAITDLALLLLDQVRPADGSLPGEAVAKLMHEASETIAAYARGMDDGQLDVSECERILAELSDLERAARAARAVVEGERRRRLSA